MLREKAHVRPQLLFVHQVLHDRLPPDVDDERHLGPDRRDVGKVLLRPDTKIDAAVHVAVTVPGRLITNGSGEQLTGRAPSKASNAIAVGLTEPVSQPPHELVKTT